MKITADTNVLVRANVQDDLKQGAIAAELITTAELVAVPMEALCEFCWVLRSVYGYDSTEIAVSVRALANSDNVRLDRAAVDAGLAILDAGGDFADGVIAHAGEWLGGEIYASFDKKAVKLVKAQGQETMIPG